MKKKKEESSLGREEIASFLSVRSKKASVFPMIVANRGRQLMMLHQATEQAEKVFWNRFHSASSFVLDAHP